MFGRIMEERISMIDGHTGFCTDMYQLTMAQAYFRDGLSESEFDNARRKSTGLEGYLKQKGVGRVFCAGEGVRTSSCPGFKSF
jgi:nicotinic acid phosphoribosyltransferase